MKKKGFLRNLAGLAGVAALAAAMLFPTGCSKLLPTSPGQDQVDGYPAEVLWPEPPANLVSLADYLPAIGSGWIGSSGGELNFQTNNLAFDFVVPSGALAEEVRISVAAAMFFYWDGTAIRRGIRFVFKPDGLVFSVPAEIRLRATVLNAQKGDVLKLYWFNPQTGRWKIEQRVKVEGPEFEVEFDIHHFSRYAIS